MMMKTKNIENHESISNIFEKLTNTGLKFLVMRNYEALNQDNLFADGHEDIDLLCDNHYLAIKALNAVPIYHFPHRNSYMVKVKNLDVQVDIRFLGDGYYDLAWQNDMLNHRIEHTKNIFIMDPENLFYSLIFHATFHKNFMSDDYLTRLIDMARSLKLIAECENCLIKLLFEFMNKKGYRATITRDPGIILNYDKIPRNLIQPNPIRQFKRCLLRLGNYRA